MPFNTSKALSIAAFISSTILIAVAIATIYFSSHADDLLTKAFPPGDYGVNLYYSEETKKGLYPVGVQQIIRDQDSRRCGTEPSHWSVWSLCIWLVVQGTLHKTVENPKKKD